MMEPKKETAASWLPAMGLSLRASKPHFDQAASVAIDLSQAVANSGVTLQAWKGDLEIVFHINNREEHKIHEIHEPHCSSTRFDLVYSLYSSKGLGRPLQ